MPKKKQKMLVLDYDPDTTAVVRDMLTQHSDVTFVDSLKKAAAKAKTGKFDLIITGYLAPSVSGKKTVSTLNNIKKAISQTEADVEKKRAAGEKILHEAQENQTKIIKLLTDHTRQSEVERLEAKQQVQGLEEKAKAVEEKLAETEKTAQEAQKLKEEAKKRAEEADKKRVEAEAITEAERQARAEAEDKAEAALISKTETEKKFAEAIETAQAELNAKVASLREELNNAISIAETAVEERNQFEEKLARFQENWEKYVGGQGA